MTARRQRLAPGVEQDLQKVIAILAEALAEKERGRVRSQPRLPLAVNPVRPVAQALARCVAEGDNAGARDILGRRRTHSEWRRLALALAEPSERGAA